MIKKRKKELSMRKIREVLRLGLKQGLGNREIGRSCSLSPGTVGKYLEMAKKVCLGYPRIEEMNDAELILFLKNIKDPLNRGAGQDPDWEYIHHELKKKGVTLRLLWEEYKESTPDGYQSSQFYEHYSRFRKKLKVYMRQTHKAGEKMFTDYAGQTVPITDCNNGEIKAAQLFVSVLGASNYTYAECTWSQNLSDWIGSHVRTFEFYGGVPQLVIPDNLKSGVTKACRYEPDINPSYHDMSIHYGTVIIPARVRKPKDKAKVEAGVLLAERWILAALRNRLFFSLSELNEAIAELLKKLNSKPFQKLQGSRQSWFESIDHPALLPLPVHKYVFSEWKKVKANMDYHVDLNRHYYSVPYKLVQESLEMRYTGKTVEIFYRGKRVASHNRDNTQGEYTTRKEHMPKSHQRYLEWNPSRIIEWAATVGESTTKVVKNIMNERAHVEQGYRSCMGIMRLKKLYPTDRLESACSRALFIGGVTYKSVKSILDKGLDQQPLPTPQNGISVNHGNIRGSQYFS